MSLCQSSIYKWVVLLKVLKVMLRVRTSVALACFLHLKWVEKSVVSIVRVCAMSDGAVQHQEWRYVVITYHPGY